MHDRLQRASNAEESRSSHDDACAPPHVLFLADHLGHPGGVVHGVTSYLTQTLPALKNAGIGVSACFIRDEHPAAAVLRTAGIDVTFLNMRPCDPRALVQIRRLIHDRGTSVIHATQFASCFMARLLSKTERIQAVLHIHDLTTPPVLVRLMYRLAANSRDYALCISESARDRALASYHLAPGRVRVMYPGVDIASFGARAGARAQIRAELRIDAFAPVIAMVARFHAVKNHRGMLRMFARLLQRVPESVLLLIGDGPEAAETQKLAEELNVAAHIRFLGSRDDVAALLTAADVVAIPSLSEGLSLAAVEANLVGKPVVAFNVGGLREVFSNHVSGTLVEPGDESAFISELARWLAARDTDENSAARAAMAAERFSLTAHVCELSDLYQCL